MAKDSDNDPDDLTASSSGSARGRGIPRGSGGNKKKVVGDLSAEKQGLPSFSKQKVKGRASSDDLDVSEADLPAEAAKQEIRDPSLAKRSTQEVAADQEDGPSGNEQEEELRRKGGRPKSVRAADFEPQAWESSETRVDRGDFDDDEAPAEVGGLAACGRAVTNGLGNFWSRLNVFEMASVAAFLVVAIIGLFFFRNLVHSGPAPEKDSSSQLSDVALPAKGNLLTLSEIDAVWRDAVDADSVRPGQLLVPDLKVVLGGGTGYLRVLFRDDLGKIRGDTFTQKVSAGKVNGSSTFNALCSEGYTNKMKIVEVQAGRMEPWTVEIFETQEYDVPLEEWNLLAGFDMPSKPKEGDSPS